MLTSLFLKKAWIWIKHHWYVPVILVLLVVAFFGGSKVKEKYFDLLTKQRDNYKKEIESINKHTEEKEQKKEELVKENKEKIKKIEEEFEIKVEELEEEKKQELEKTVEELADKPDELAKSIANLLGSNLVEK